MRRAEAFWENNTLYIDDNEWASNVSIDEAAAILADLSDLPNAPLVMEIYV